MNVLEHHLRSRCGMLLLLITGATYLASIQAGFVFDDIFIIVQNRYLSESGNLAGILYENLWAGELDPDERTSFYRPLFLLSLYVDRLLFGLSAPWHHFHSLLWHLLCVGLLYRLLLFWFTPLQACLGAAVFALHPVQSEVVVWVSARNDSMATAFSLGAMLLLCGQKYSFWRGGVGVCLGMAAFLSKESAMALPLWVFLLSSDRKFLRGIWPFLGVAAALILRSRLGISPSLPDADHLALLQSKFIPMMADVWSTLLAPWPLSPTHALAWMEPEGWRMLAAMLVLVLMGLRGWRGGPMARTGLLIWVTAFAPTIFAVAMSGVYGDRYQYLPMMGIGFLIAGLRLAWWQPIPIVLLYLGLIFLRLPDWRDDRALWSAVARDYPSPYSHVSLAHIRNNYGEHEAAFGLYRKGFSHPTPYLAECTSYVMLAFKLHGPKRGLEEGEWAQGRGCPLTGKMAGALALIHASIGEWEQAEELLAGALPDPTRRGDVVQAAIYLRSGDLSSYVGLRSDWASPASMDGQIQVLLDTDRSMISIPSLPLR
jgi:protein O-mannosyl-transferase